LGHETDWESEVGCVPLGVNETGLNGNVETKGGTYEAFQWMEGHELPQGKEEITEFGGMETLLRAGENHKEALPNFETTAPTSKPDIVQLALQILKRPMPQPDSQA
jgi:hypothetical protein